MSSLGGSITHYWSHFFLCIGEIDKELVDAALFRWGFGRWRRLFPRKTLSKDGFSLRQIQYENENGNSNNKKTYLLLLADDEAISDISDI